MMVVLATSCSLHAATKTHTRNDTVFFYKSWQQVFDLTPEVFLVNPYIEAETPFSIRILTDDDKDVDVLGMPTVVISKVSLSAMPIHLKI